MVKNMNFNDPDNLDNSSMNGDNINDDQHQHNIVNISDDENMDETNEDQLDETEEADPEYSLLDKQLDDLNSVLDVLEQKNDSIQTQLRVLLENSREIRHDLAKERETDNSGTAK